MSRPRPVLTAASVAGLLTSIAGILTFLGYSSAATTLSGEAQGVGAAAVGLILAVAHVAAGLHSQEKVTPLSSPRAADGSPLVKVDVAALAAPVARRVAIVDPMYPGPILVAPTPAQTPNDGV